MSVNTNVEPSLASVPQRIVAVAMQHPSSMVCLVPGEEWVMTHDDLGAVVTGALVVVFDPLESFVGRTLDALVVVSLDQPDGSVQPSDQTDNLLRPHEGKVAQVIDNGRRRNHAIPGLDHLLVHLVNMLEGPVGVLDYVCMSEMVIGRNVFVFSHIYLCD